MKYQAVFSINRNPNQGMYEFFADDISLNFNKYLRCH